MNLQDRFYIIKDDFEVMKKLEKLPPDVLTDNQQILKHIQEKSYGKDYGAVFSDHKYTYILYKFGNINDSGLFMVYVKDADVLLLKLYVENGAQVLPNTEIRNEMVKNLAALALKYPNPLA